MQATQSPVLIGDWGYQVYGAAGPSESGIRLGAIQVALGAGLRRGDRVGNQTALRAEAQGALSYADGGLFASNSINDSFAVVDTAGAAESASSNENREVGRTDSAGRVLVPDLRSYDLNSVAIDPTDVPIGCYGSVYDHAGCAAAGPLGRRGEIPGHAPATAPCCGSSTRGGRCPSAASQP